jgi:hypothetical protein
MNKSFLHGFEKTAAASLPKWLREHHKTINPLKTLKNFSGKSIHKTKAGRELRK